jgi:hypothetical protein
MSASQLFGRIEQSVSLQTVQSGFNMSARLVILAMNKVCADLSAEWRSSSSESVAAESGRISSCQSVPEVHMTFNHSHRFRNELTSKLECHIA